MKQYSMRCTLGILSAVLILLSTSEAASATTYYVSTNGNNSNSGLNTTSAWRNIQYAANHVQSGDTVQVLGGLYNELVNIPTSGSATAGYITFQNYPGQTPIV